MSIKNESMKSTVHQSRVAGAPIFLCAYFALLTVAFLVLQSPATMVGGNRLSIDRAIFATVNTGTLTGFQMAIAPADYQLPGQITVLVLTLLVTIGLLQFGGMCVARLLRVHIADHQIFLWSLSLPILSASFIAIFYTPTGISFHAALMMGLGAVANSGVILTSNIQPDWRLYVLLLPSAFIGSMGVVVLIELVARRGPLSAHTRATLTLSALFYVVGAIILLAFLPDHSLPRASALVMESRTYGLPVVSISSLPRIIPWLLAPLMFVGGGSGSTSGGVKLTTLLCIAHDRRALRLVGIFSLLIFVSWLALIVAAPQIPVDRLLFLALSAASNVGLSHDPLSVVGEPLYILSATMLMGRILPIYFLYRVAQTGQSDFGIG